MTILLCPSSALVEAYAKLAISFTNKILLNGNSYLEIRIMSQIEKADALEGQSRLVAV